MYNTPHKLLEKLELLQIFYKSLWERPHNTYAFRGGGVSDLLRSTVNI